MRARLFGAGVAAVLVPVAPAAAVTMISQTLVVNAAPTGAPQTLGFQQFDGALGQLLSVTLEFDGGFAAQGTLRNPAAAPSSRSYTLTRGVSVGITGGGFSLSTPMGTGSQAISVPAQTTIPLAFAASGVNSQTLSTGLQGFVGPGQVFLSYLGTSLFSATGNGQLNLASATSANVRLLYAYEPAGGVPEPASWALLIAGFGLVGTAARRRRLASIAARMT